MIGLSTATYDPNGALRLNSRLPDERQADRRGTITATLDGGCSVYDGGYSVTDQAHQRPAPGAGSAESVAIPGRLLCRIDPVL